jgi:AraC-like DNA-binding protein
MRFALRRPEGPLSGFVQQVWFYEGYVQPHARERLLPDGTMELVINLSEDVIRVWDRRDLTRYERLDGAVLVGPHSEYFVIDTAEQRCVMGVHFRAGGAFPFLGMPADELHGQHVSLRDLWGGFARELRERLLTVESIQARFDLVEAALLRQVQRPLAYHPAVGFAVGQFHRRPRAVAEVREETGLSARRFIEVFRQQVGMTPKQYSRVRRFQRIVQRLPEGAAVDWSGAAIDAGYCDQSHLIHEFQAISGLSPGTWAELRTEHRNHVPMVEAG